MKRHTLTLLGGSGSEVRVSGVELHAALGALLDGARAAVRFAVEGESQRMGPRPAWLDAACAVDVVGLAAGSTAIELEAVVLGEVDAERFDVSHDLEDGEDVSLADQSSIDAFGRVLAAVVEEPARDVAADRGLLEACVRFARLASTSGGVELSGVFGHVDPVRVTADAAGRIELLRDETPRPRAARISGTLDTVSASRRDIALVLGDGTRVPGRLGEHDLDTLRAFLGRPVVVSGMAHYRPSGRLLRVHVESLAEPGPRDALFDRVPAASEPFRSRDVVVEQDERSGVSSLFGTWPGDESEAELLDALRALG